MPGTGPRVAPGRLAILQAFVNTGDNVHGREGLPSSAALHGWLLGEGLMSPDEGVTGADLRWAVEVREALRSLLLANNGVPADPASVGTLNQAVARSRLTLRFGEALRSELVPEASGVDAALGRVLAAAFAAVNEGTWDRLKVCRNEDCRWAFYDRSKNRSATWCSMAECGNRMKARAFRQRRRLQAASA